MAAPRGTIAAHPNPRLSPGPSVLTQQIPTSLGEQRTSDTIRRALDMWERVTPLSFKELPAVSISNQSALADIMLLFASGFHGDMSLFDGEGGSLAHAFYPGPGIGGDVHFDADERWTLDSQGQTGLFGTGPCDHTSQQRG